MPVPTMQEPALARGITVTLLPIMGVVFVGFLVIGLAMPVLPLHVHDGLGFGTFVVGLVAGSQFAASLISRPWAGHFSDALGAKRGVVAGLMAAAAAGLLYLLSFGFSGSPSISVAILLAGRALLGGAESFIITAAVSWGLALAHSSHTGKVIAGRRADREGREHRRPYPGDDLPRAPRICERQSPAHCRRDDEALGPAEQPAPQQEDSDRCQRRPAEAERQQIE